MAPEDSLNRSPYSDGFRTPGAARNPRWPASGGPCVAPALLPPAGRPIRPSCAVHINKPCNCWALRPATPGAARVGFPERRRTAGKLQSSGVAWGAWHEAERQRVGPARKLPVSYGP